MVKRGGYVWCRQAGNGPLAATDWINEMGACRHMN